MDNSDWSDWIMDLCCCWCCRIVIIVMVVARNRRISDGDSDDGRMLIDFAAALDLDGADDDIYDSLLRLLLVN